MATDFMTNINAEKKNIFNIVCPDISHSMLNEGIYNNKTITFLKAEEDGINQVVKNYQQFSQSSLLYDFKLQIIPYSTSAVALFPNYKKAEEVPNDIKLSASGVTRIEPLFEEINKFLDRSYLIDGRLIRQNKGYNKQVNIIVISDGEPTDNEGNILPYSRVQILIDNYYNELKRRGMENHVCFYAVLIGERNKQSSQFKKMEYLCHRGFDYEERDCRVFFAENCADIVGQLNLLSMGTIGDPVKDELSDFDLDDLARFEEEI